MKILRTMRRQEATWWSRTGTEQDGRPTFTFPVVVSCRWQDQAMQYRNEAGEEKTSRAIVFVDRPMKPGDYLLEGRTNTSPSINPSTVPNAFRVEQFDRMPTMKAKAFMYKAIF